MIGIEADGSLRVTPSGPLRGEIELEGDKSVAHRALILAAIGRGTSVVRNLPSGDDVQRTIQMIRDLGVTMEGLPLPPSPYKGEEDPLLCKEGRGEVERQDRVVRIHGGGWAGLKSPSGPLDAGNSGTTLRLMMGILSACPFTSILETSEGLRRRPVERVAVPLRLMGAKVWANKGGRFPPVVISGGDLRGIRYRLPVASAQVKSAVLLAGLRAKGRTTVVEPQPTRDHTERMLTRLGVDLRRRGSAITVAGGAIFDGCEMDIPGDLSSAAFVLAAAALVPGSAVRIRRCLLNPGRLEFVRFLEDAGVETEIIEEGESCGEPWGTIAVVAGAVKAVNIGPKRVAPLIDELPLVGVMNACAPGRSTLRGAGELRVKETDRIRSIVSGLRAMGAGLKEHREGWDVSGGRPLRGAELDARGDHRTAMALAVAALSAEGVTVIRNPGIEKSFPTFPAVMNRLMNTQEPNQKPSPLYEVVDPPSPRRVESSTFQGEGVPSPRRGEG